MTTSHLARKPTDDANPNLPEERMHAENRRQRPEDRRRVGDRSFATDRRFADDSESADEPMHADRRLHAGSRRSVESVINVDTARSRADDMGPGPSSSDAAGAACDLPADQISQIDIDVAGMTCASCVGRVERALKRVDGITDASVNLATERARVFWPAGDAAHDATIAENAVAAIRKAGYEAVLRQRPGATGARLRDATPTPTQARAPTTDEHVHSRAGEASPLSSEASIASGVTAQRTRPALPDPGRIELSGSRVLMICCILSLPLVAPMLLAPFGMHRMPPPGLQFSLATAVLLLGGIRFYRAAWHAVRSASGNMELLVVIGTTAAWALSSWLWLARDAGAHALYFESAAVVVTLVLMGKQLEYQAKRKTLVALDALSSLQPEFAVRLDGETETTVPIVDLKVGDRLVIRPGERVPADATIIDGASSLDESMLTGEAMPVARHPTDAVTGGSINGEGRLMVEVSRLGTESTLARIIRLVEDAQAKKPPIQRLVDRISSVFVPAVIAIAIATLGFWLWRGVGIETALIHAVAVLVIACPCALGLATPAAIMAGTGSAARAGILIRDPSALEAAHDVKLVAFDKTGTLTQGHPALREVEAAPGVDADALVSVAAAIQNGSEHPLAGAVLRYAHEKGIVPLQANGIRAITGAGIEGRIAVPGSSPGGRASTSRVVVGSETLMIREAIDTAPLVTRANELQRDGMTVAWVAMSEGPQAPEGNGAGAAPRSALLGLLAFADTPRETATDAIRLLHAAGIDTAILSGDNPQAARMIGQRLGVRESVGGLLPDGKVAWLENARTGDGKTRRAIAMVGDGINDAPALAAADLGIAMGDGSDVAMETAQVTLMRSDPRLVPAAIDIGRRTRANLRQNLFWAFAYNVVGIPLAAAGLLSPVVAGAAMAASSICVLGNALRLTRWKPKTE